MPTRNPRSKKRQTGRGTTRNATAKKKKKKGGRGSLQQASTGKTRIAASTGKPARRGNMYGHTDERGNWISNRKTGTGG